jgi:L-alanine-DL-glutamate epimerase-like enolase superfamily enzyme
MSSDLVIETVEVWACSLPLAQPLDFGTFQVHERFHTVMRVKTRGGLVADCVTQSRGSPIDVAAADLIAPRVIGRDASAVLSIGEDLRRSMAALEFDGVIGRAWSVMDICLQDLRAQAAGVPLWKFLGGAGGTAPVQLVEGYALVGESDEEFAERLAARAKEGYPILKVEAAHYADLQEIIHRIELFREKAGGGTKLVLDFAWSWRDAKSYLGFVAALEDLGVLWVEDPFPRTRVEAYRTLREGARVPIGCGDEATRPEDLYRLIREGAIDQLRTDATTIGGIEAARLLTAEAHANGIGVSYHEHPEVHEHCAFAFPGVNSVEVFPTDRPFDRVHDLVEEAVFDRVTDGHLMASDKLGTGIRLNEEFVRSCAYRSHLVGKE